MVKKKSKQLKPVDHTELNEWKNELISKQTHTLIKTGSQTSKKGCCKIHTLIRCTLGTVTYLLVIAALLKYLEIFTLTI